MADYRLSGAAEEDLIAIVQYGDEQFGLKQSDQYREKLKHRFSALADNPLLYPAVDHIGKGFRRSVYGSHSIYYRIEEQGVLVLRILGQQDTSKAFRAKSEAIYN